MVTFFKHGRTKRKSVANSTKHRKDVTAGKEDRNVTVRVQERRAEQRQAGLFKKRKTQKEGKPVPMEINKPLQLWGFGIWEN